MEALNNIMQVPFGLSIAATVRVGNELGAGNPLRAKRAAYTAIGVVGTLHQFCGIWYIHCIYEQ